MSDIQATLAERGSRYGSFADDDCGGWRQGLRKRVG
jgi:hypothetical protein